MRFLTIGDLQRESLRKSLDGGGQSPESVEAELLTMLDNCKNTLAAAMQQHASIRSKFVANMTPASRAALEVMGKDVSKSISALEETNLELQKRLIDVRRSRSRALAKGDYSEAARDLATLKEHQRLINTGTVRVAPEVRRRLVAALGVAELRLAESA